MAKTSTRPTKLSKNTKTKVCLRDLDPLEQGGRIARDGFEYQDHIAVGKCLEMLLDGGPVEVWCETEDDIVQVWLIEGEELFEFVQVKGNDLGQAWTVAKLDELEITQKSLAHDRAAEKCRFRVVTRWSPDSTLSPLRAPFLSEARKENEPAIKAAGVAVQSRLPLIKSPNGNDAEFWAQMMVWEVKETTRAVQNENTLKLERLLELKELHLNSDQRQNLYDRLYLRIQDASLKCGRTEKSMKRLKKNELLSWLLKEANAIIRPAAAGVSTNLERKLLNAHISAASIEAAKEHRWRYLQEVRTPKFLSLEQRDKIEAQVLARLHRLKTQLDAAELADSGPQFLSRCQQTLIDLSATVGVNPQPDDWFMFGYMYDVMNRCLHELVKAPT